MRGFPARVGRWIVRVLTRKFCAEVLVSSLATIGVTLLYSGSHLKPEPELQPIPQASSLTRQASFAMDAGQALPDANGLLPLGYPAQFETQFSVRQSLATAKAAWSRAASTAECLSDCGSERSLPLILTVLPPERPADLKPQIVATAAAVTVMAPPASLMRPSTTPEPRAQILGMKLPGFVPSSEKVVSTMSSLGHRIIDLVPGF